MNQNNRAGLIPEEVLKDIFSDSYNMWRCEWTESGYGSYICSACNIEWFTDDGTPEIKYCPNCGAKLEVAR